MSPSFSAGKSGRLYRYYVSSAQVRGTPAPPDRITRVAAARIEALIEPYLRQSAGGETANWSRLRRVEVCTEAVEVVMAAERPGRAAEREVRDLTERMGCIAALDPPDTIRLRIPVRLSRRRGRLTITNPNGAIGTGPAAPEATLVKAMARAHLLVRRTNGDAEAIAQGAAAITAASYLRKLARLAFLAPDIQRAILDGRQPSGLYLDQLLRSEIPCAWVDQRRLLGF